ncbi:phosphoribosylaminoimidazolesuccinocarboxamide synthase [Sulfidibacter corallicola]|uniref:Phosphoribosylaminoimidazole-succinocarboxamide synthase n=1 Tax=Sulfidibacter corallicola TaxID=2818388 RepID=A0A8A4TXA8_SULCO|nr:phosphoribosylaminoimidazolesuccinocarboxamide synthase [Sulfidibacter corallicola]QTD53967.1 phosphoribosylaminoimidazolesuccinocarboxamide synthase [Sulfidibacter corallicola]
MSNTVTEVALPGVQKVASGKVREIFDLGEHLLFVASDRISAFDVIMPTGIPNKGKVLTQLSKFWFGHLQDIVPHHLISADFDDLPSELREQAPFLRGRFMIVKKLEMFPVECVVRGYLVGSGWREYQESGSVCGIPLPSGLAQAQKLPEPIFTPAIKATDGHDENIPFSKMIDMIGAEHAEALRKVSIEIYQRAAEHALKKGVVIADTKFEFGLVDGRIVLGDEVLTPDSSRYWPLPEYRTGSNPPSYDKQFVRDYLETLDWDKTPPGPELPEQIVQGTAERYSTCFETITGTSLKGV